METPAVLWIDDDQWEWGPIRRRILGAGAAILAAASAAEGLRILAERKPDAIVLDILLPGGRGTAQDRLYAGLQVWSRMSDDERARTIVLSVMIREDLTPLCPAIESLPPERLFDKVAVDRELDRFDRVLRDILAARSMAAEHPTSTRDGQP